jgi:hypothetical protein
MENQGVLTTYRAILRGNYLHWRNNMSIPVPPDRAVEVYVTVLEETVTPTASPESQGQRMAAALEQLVQLHTCTAIADPVAWERQLRRERNLPGREKGSYIRG